jgi:uncharacterized protein YfaP (DUF2135 family)
MDAGPHDTARLLIIKGLRLSMVLHTANTIMLDAPRAAWIERAANDTVIMLKIRDRQVSTLVASGQRATTLVGDLSM